MKNLLNLCYPFSNSLSFIIYFLYREFMSSEVHLELENEMSGWIQNQDACNIPHFSVFLGYVFPPCVLKGRKRLCLWLWHLAEMTLVKD